MSRSSTRGFMSSGAPIAAGNSRHPAILDGVRARHRLRTMKIPLNDLMHRRPSFREERSGIVEANVLYHSLPGLASPRVRCMDYRNQSIREFLPGLLRIRLELGCG